MQLWQDSRYQALARRAADALGAPVDGGTVVAAILAQWQCEQPSGPPWPPIHDNPGNLTASALRSLGLPVPAVATSGAGTGILAVYPSPEAGTDAYVAYLLRSPRYVSAIAHARAGDGYGFLTAVCEGGYGTALGCAGPICRSIPDLSAPAPTPSVHHWQAVYGGINIRLAPNTSAPIVGTIAKGTEVTGPEVAGGDYTARGKVYGGWIEIDPGRYVAHAFFAQLD